MRSIAIFVYRLLLFAYPAEFRRRFGSAMVATFEDLTRQGVARRLLQETLDVLVSAFRERVGKANRPPPVPKGTKMELFWKDLRHAARALIKAPSFTAIAVVSLALGIGANAAIFSMVNAVLLKPMPVKAPEELVAVYATRSTGRMPLLFSYPNFLDLEAETDVFADLVGFQGAPLSLNAGGDPELVWSETVTGSYFSGLGVQAAVGRMFLPDEVATPGASAVAVLSHDFWQRRFSGRESIVGETIELNGHDFTIVGVARSGFTGAKFLGFTPDLWVPVTMHEVVWSGSAGRLERRSGGWLNLRGRLRPGLSLSEAEAALTTIASRLEAQYPDVNAEWRLHAIAAPRKTEPFIEVEIGSFLPAVSVVLFAVVGIVLLIACANVASLQLVRAMGREKEMAVRVSLGATRSRIVRQLLMESLLLALVAGAAGIWLSERLLEGALRLNPVLDFSVGYGVSLDARVLFFTVVVSLVAGIVSGLFPALKIARGDVNTSLKDADPRVQRWAGRRWIVIPQLALSLVALVCAGLLLQSFRNVSSSDPGFETERLLLASVNLGLQGYEEPEGETFHRQLVERLGGLAGVESASLASPLPLDAYAEGERVFPDEDDLGPDKEGMFTFSSTVGVGYFETMGTRLVHGRAFEEHDVEESRPVAIVNETLARRFWPDENALGKRVRLGRDGPAVEIIGVARDGKYLTLGEEPRPYLYLPLLQNYRSPITIVVRTTAAPRSVEPTLRAEVRGLDPTLPVYGVKTVTEFMSRSLAGPKALALIVSMLAALALVLTTVGVYGLMSFSVSQKRHELGIRIALGASKRDVLALFLKQAASLVGIGLAMGLALAWAATRLLASLLYGVSESNPAVFASVAILLAVVALAGSFFPSRRAATLDPIVALRHE